MRKALDWAIVRAHTLTTSIAMGARWLIKLVTTDSFRNDYAEIVRKHREYERYLDDVLDPRD